MFALQVFPYTFTLHVHICYALQGQHDDDDDIASMYYYYSPTITMSFHWLSPFCRSKKTGSRPSIPFLLVWTLYSRTGQWCSSSRPCWMWIHNFLWNFGPYVLIIVIVIANDMHEKRKWGKRKTGSDRKQGKYRSPMGSDLCGSKVNLELYLSTLSFHFPLASSSS